ncbi:VAN3-binding protein isoform X2 [Ricinus communis]|uniref:VAN3-binding protein isoform X2 n=1 Tax=Ricinus communis TaxID=3988 RepID=UPI000D6980B0|nr:VAN3-binding protein isoform X2 [Ricinus communis]|eukprot:XP_025012675.1 VAN3-binding protein isoform X2 [Ricinus communis]
MRTFNQNHSAEESEPSGNSKLRMSSSSTKSLSKKLENIDENGPALWQPVPCDAPETPTESMEFLARSWSVSAVELSKALSNTHATCDNADKLPFSSSETVAAPKDSFPNYSAGSPPISPRDSEEMKELFLLHQVLNPEFLSSQQLLKTGLYRSILKGRTMGRWLKDQKERKKQEIRTHNAQLHAAVSVAGLAAAIAALAASNAMSAEMAATCQKTSSKTSAAMASAAALVASHCIELAEDMGANHDQILTVVNSAVNARSSGDIMTLTAGAATALRGANTLKASFQKGYITTAFALVEEKSEEGKESNILAALNFVTRGGELLKRTRKGIYIFHFNTRSIYKYSEITLTDSIKEMQLALIIMYMLMAGALHWKQVSFNINSTWQVVAKLKSKHMAGTFTKKKKCVVSGVYSDIPAWPGREREDCNEQRAYFGIKTAERVIEFECRSKGEKLIWTEGIQQMLSCRANLKYETTSNCFKTSL